MKITAITRIQWDHPKDALMMIRKNFEASMFIAKMEWQNKTKCFFIKHLDANTAERLWVDQGAAKEFVQHQHYLASKYHGKILNFEIADVDISV